MAYLLLSLTTLFWAGNFVLGRSMNSVISPIVMAELRWLLALLIISPFLLPRLKKNKAIILQHWPILILLSVLSVACFNTFIYLGLTITTATNATILQSVIPIAILILSAFWLKEAVSKQQWLGVFISLTGVLILITKGNLASLLDYSINQGDIYVLIAVIFWATYSILLRYRPAELDGFTFFGITVLVGSIVLLPFSLIEYHYYSQAIVWQKSSLLTILYMAIFPSILAYIFWNKGVSELGAAKAGLFIHLMPCFGLVLSSFFLNEKIYPFHIGGILLIFCGIYLAVFTKIAFTKARP
ncbi:MAG: EamA family transporter [Gammaproteobacteria bacterium]|nr:MAG: EamA family transporter [Gammaproteobacteria bacterium]PHR85287.1 MAG: EamA family transporter [Colwellia sp.]